MNEITPESTLVRLRVIRRQVQSVSESVDSLIKLVEAAESGVDAIAVSRLFYHVDPLESLLKAADTTAFSLVLGVAARTYRVAEE